MGASNQPERTGPLIEWKACVGTIARGDRSLDVVCDVTVSSRGAIEVVVHDIPLTDHTWWVLESVTNERGLRLPDYKLELRADNGDQLRTELFHILTSGTKGTQEGSVIRLRGTAATMTVGHAPTDEWDAANSGVIAKYTTVGLKAFGQASVESDIGRVTLAGVHDLEEYDQLAGELRIDNSEATVDDVDGWLAVADARTRDILLIISLAAGRFVRWSVREVFVGRIRRSIEFHGPHGSGAPYDPLLHHMVLTDFLDVAANHYSHSLGAETGLDVAIEWFVMNHRYSEARFLATISALEHLVSKHASAAGSVLPRRAFAALRGAVDEVLRREETRLSILESFSDEQQATRELVDEALVEIRAKFGNLNARSLQTKAGALLADYRVPTDDVKLSVGELMAMRNQLVHRGIHRGSEDEPELLVAVSALRELVRRLFMAILGYEGTYYSFLNGPEQMQFRRLPPRA